MEPNIRLASVIADLLVVECRLSKTAASLIFDCLADGIDQAGIDEPTLTEIIEEAESCFSA
jgi:hypothetical protein